jgi:hypothetical protein
MVVRMAVDIHARLAADAKKNGVSVNARLNHFITEGLTKVRVVEDLREAIHLISAEEAARRIANSAAYKTEVPARPDTTWDSPELRDPMRSPLHEERQFAQVS